MVLFTTQSNDRISVVLDSEKNLNLGAYVLPNGQRKDYSIVYLDNINKVQIQELLASCLIADIISNKDEYSLYNIKKHNEVIKTIQEHLDVNYPDYKALYNKAKEELENVCAVAKELSYLNDTLNKANNQLIDDLARARKKVVSLKNRNKTKYKSNPNIL